MGLILPTVDISRRFSLIYSFLSIIIQFHDGTGVQHCWYYFQTNDAETGSKMGTVSLSDYIFCVFQKLYLVFQVHHSVLSFEPYERSWSEGTRAL